ncbi:hypothetical protein ABT364_05720 [Massilia sp. SR12]
MGQDTITFKCSCGSTKFETPRNPAATDMVKCVKCGASGKYGELMKDATRQAKSLLDKQIKDALKKAGFK